MLNTENEKMSSGKQGAEADMMSVTEDRLVDELLKQKVHLFLNRGLNFTGLVF